MRGQMSGVQGSAWFQCIGLWPPGLRLKAQQNAPCALKTGIQVPPSAHVRGRSRGAIDPDAPSCTGSGLVWFALDGTT